MQVRALVQHSKSGAVRPHRDHQTHRAAFIKPGSDSHSYHLQPGGIYGILYKEVTVRIR